MTYFWIFVTIPLLGLIYLAGVILQTGGIKPPDHVAPCASHDIGSASKSVDYKNGREVRWISASECENLLRRSSDIIFIDLQSETENRPTPLTVPEALSVSRSQLFDLLKWLPDSSSVVVSGASDFYTSILWLSYNIQGHAPIYLLRSGSCIKCPA